jgi:K+-sensing histidine kinase KdpD
MEIVIKSLLENAIFYSQSAKQPNVRVDIDLTPTKAIFSVENNGDYVRPKNKNDLFKMFTTYDNKSKGSGLGLYIAREAVIKLEGKISYTSRPSRTIIKAVIPNVRQD